MRRIRVYVDTSVFGGVQDDEFAEASRRFFDLVRSGEYVVLVCDEVLREIAKAPNHVKEVWENLPPELTEELPVTEKARELAEEYLKAGVVGEASTSDALHVAAATVAGADLILSWNFKHIVNFTRIRAFNSVNLKQGYRSMVIMSPLGVSDED